MKNKVSEISPVYLYFLFITLYRQDGFSYCPNYKVATTTWTIMMLKMRGYWSDRTSLSDVNGVFKKRFPSLTKVNHFKTAITDTKVVFFSLFFSQKNLDI